jgi:hypothetical protein
MKKKQTKTKRSPKRQQKIDIVLESLLNLETVVKELIKEVNQLKNKNHQYRDIMWIEHSTNDN